MREGPTLETSPNGQLIEERGYGVERRQVGKGCFVRTTEPVAVLRDQGHP